MFGFLWSVDSEARQVLLRAVADKVDADQQVRLFKSSPFEKVTWLTVDEYGTEISTRYWKEVFPEWSRRHSDSDLNEFVDRLLVAERPRAACHAARMDWARLETSRLKRLLTDVATVDVEPQGTFRLDAHDISKALEALDGRAGVTANDMAQMEFRFVSALDHSKHGIPNLERQIAESPLLYMQVMALLWKRSDDGEDPAEWRIEDPERRGTVASAMHRVLQQMKRIPGTDADGKIVANALTDWLTQVRALARFVADVRVQDVTPHVAQRVRGSAIDGRTTRHAGYHVSQRKRKLVEQVFGWMKTVGGLRKLRHRGIALVDWQLTFAATAYNLVRLRNLEARCP